MPELPEVQTTVNGLRKHVVGLTIRDVWTDYNSPHFKGSETIKDPAYFKHFKRAVIGSKIISIDRRAKNILINLNKGKTVLVHMKMTGFLFLGHHHSDKFTHFKLTFLNGQILGLSDLRKFAKVTLVDTKLLHNSIHLNGLGPEPLDQNFTFDKFTARLRRRSKGKIKQVLMDQSVLVGIGNIYADEALWRAGIHPLQKVADIPETRLKALFKAIRQTLAKGIALGGDSMSDYRNIYGKKGQFQEKHRAYRRTGLKCSKKSCGGIIRRVMVGARSAHYCDRHQRLFRN